MTGADVGTVKFAMALRGYRMSDVDWALERMGGEIDRLRAEIAALSGGDGSAGTDGTTDTEQAVFADAGPSRAPSARSAPIARPAENPSTQTTGDS